jgi:hypothetical protein
MFAAFNDRNLANVSSSLVVNLIPAAEEQQSDDEDLKGVPTEGDDEAGGNDNPATSSVQQQKSSSSVTITSSPSKTRKQTSSGTACSWKCQSINMFKGQPCARGKKNKCTLSACEECSKMATGEDNVIVCHTHASKDDKERWHKFQQSSKHPKTTKNDGRAKGGGVRTSTTH